MGDRAHASYTQDEIVGFLVHVWGKLPDTKNAELARETLAIVHAAVAEYGIVNNEGHGTGGGYAYVLGQRPSERAKHIVVRRNYATLAEAADKEQAELKAKLLAATKRSES